MQLEKFIKGVRAALEFGHRTITLNDRCEDKPIYTRLAVILFIACPSILFANASPVGKKSKKWNFAPKRMI